MGAHPIAAGLVGLSLCVIALPAPAGPVIYSDPEDHYSLKLPEGWQEAPGLVEVANRRAPRSAEAPRIHYVKAFQPPETWQSGYPYLLIQPYGAEGPTPPIAKVHDEILKKYPPDPATGLRTWTDADGDNTFVRPPFIRGGRMIWSVAEGRSALAGKTKEFGALCLGRHKAVFLDFYALESQWPAYEPIFQAIAESLAFEPGYEYDETFAQEHWGKKRDWGRAALGGAIGALVGGMGVVLVWSMCRFRNRATRRTDPPAQLGPLR